MRNRRAQEPEVVSITSAREAHSDDHDRRMKRYLISMAIRTLCFLLAVLTPSPWRWFFAVGAVVLPYIAVIMANAGYRTKTIDPTVASPRAAREPHAPAATNAGESPMPSAPSPTPGP